MIFVKSGHIIWGKDIAVADFHKGTKKIDSALMFNRRTCEIFADFIFGPTEGKRLIVVLVEREHIVSGFAHVFLLFNIIVQGTPVSHEREAF